MDKMNRPAVAAALLSISLSALYKWAEQGLLTRPVRLGPKAAAWPDSELLAIMTARAAGADDAAIRELVERLHALRGSRYTALTESLNVEPATA